MALAEKLQLLRGTKQEIKAAIEEKGQEVGEIPFSEYPEKIRAIEGGGGGGGGGDEPQPLDPMEVYKNTRPADWLPMPTPADDEMYLLFHIPDGASSLIAFTVTCTGSYTVALGTVQDGAFIQSSETSIASGTKYQAELFADDYGDLTSDGLKQVMIKVSGTDILEWYPTSHSKMPGGFYEWSIVEISCRLPKCSYIRCGGQGYDEALTNLKYFSFFGENQIKSMLYCFSGCSSLTAIIALDTSLVTDMSYVFKECRSLMAIPLLNTSSVTNMESMFYGCYSLTSIPKLNTSLVTTMKSMFYGCHSLTSVPLLDTSSVISMYYMFRDCYALKTIPKLNTSLVSDMESMFDGCGSLSSIPLLDTSSVTLTRSMFRDCYSLNTIPLLDISHVTNIVYMFYYCDSLISVPPLDISSVTATSDAFSYCGDLASIRFQPGVKNWGGDKIYLKDCQLGHAALLSLFESLPTPTSTKTLTLTGNPGVKELTSEEKKIATDKNWTLTL